MTTVYGLTADRQLEIEANSIVDARIVNDELILTTYGGTDINVGNVRGLQGPPGPVGSITQINGKSGPSVTLTVADIANAATKDDLANATTPSGLILPYGGNTAPAGWLVCDGSAVSRTTYARLFTTIGTTYGIGDNSTTFALPDLRGRMPIGLLSTDALFDTLGEKGGETSHVLSAAEMPKHHHALGTTISAITTNNYQDASNGLVNPNDGGSMASGTTSGRFSRPFTINGDTTDTGSGAAHNNMPPYLVVRYIIKT